MSNNQAGHWRRIFRVPNRSFGLPQYSTKLRVTNSSGQLYLLDQFREKVPLNIKNHVIAVLSELVGTFLFMLTGLGGTSAAISLSSNDPINPVKYLFIATSWGLSATVNAWVFFRISGGLFNPAVTIAMMIIKAVSPFRGLLIILTQIIACIAASGVLIRLVPPESVSMTELGEGTSVVQGMFIEMFLTAQVVFSIFMLATEKHKGTYIAPLGIGLAVFAAVLMGSYYTGASFNPARSFGTCLVHGKFTHYHWIYWVGPAMGSLLSTGFYLLVRKLEYWTVNPGADASESGQFKIGHDISTVKERDI